MQSGAGGRSLIVVRIVGSGVVRRPFVGLGRWSSNIEKEAWNDRTVRLKTDRRLDAGVFVVVG